MEHAWVHYAQAGAEVLSVFPHNPELAEKMATLLVLIALRQALAICWSVGCNPVYLVEPVR